ncbi:hypothetical protein ACHHYP_08896 [Achlya hypogyna]|uniref:PTHB1 N-terminal domain-containing protein n=1 Tax=Achlya hypogyna TaxID=1202772 RepID=A0A1V9YNP4_ACHHY|nr:hypothetical protein ACHHYP_08896 [Achlya hypogyna]
MSLFQAREWWSVTGGTSEEYTPVALALGNVDNDPELGHAKIVVGSLHGMLRVYYPTHAEFKIEHLLLEEQLEHPILQVAVGAFVPHSTGVAMAVLHPKLLVVYTLEGVGGTGMGASYFKLSKKYEHHLGLDGEHFTAFNMVTGPFGGSRDKDHLCVQALDGRLQFFEQDRFAFLQQFPTCLVPGALCYAPATDSLVTAASDLHVECYRYQMLATSLVKKKPTKEDTPDTKVTAAKALHAEWRVNVGEPVLDVRIGRLAAGTSAKSFDIVVLGEFTLFCLRPSGDLCFQKRLGFHPSAAVLYPADPDGNDDTPRTNIIVASHTKQWMIFKANTLVWSAVAPTISTALAVGEFGGVPGMIVSLDDEGRLGVNYLGTDPPTTTVVAASDTKEINYEEMDEEHRTLLNIIRRSQGERRSEPKERILLRAQVPAIFDAAGDSDGDDEDVGALTMRVFVTYTGSNVIQNVTLAVTAPPNVIVVSAASEVLAAVDGKATTPLIVPVLLRPSPDAMPSSLEVTISAAYTLESGQPRTSLCTVKLPMCMMCRLVPPVKASTFKVRLSSPSVALSATQFTLDTNQEPPQLTDLFQDMLSQPGATPEWAKQVTGATANVLSFQYYNGVDVTILVSKNAGAKCLVAASYAGGVGRYRIQSTELDALWMVSHELVERLRLLYDKAGDDDNVSPLEIQYQDPLPLADFFGAIDDHFQLRKAVLDLKADINDRAHEFRVIQKRLLVRFKDRNPAPLNALDVLLHGTYGQLLELATQMEAAQRKLEAAGNRLSCSVSLLLMLMRFKFELDDANFGVLRAHLSPMVTNDPDMGWEDVTEAAITELLRTTLRGGAKEPTIAPEITMQPDTKKLKKHITIVCDRLGKGAVFVGGPRDARRTDSDDGSKDDDGGKDTG